MRIAVRRLDGIHQVEASYKEGKAVVVYEPSTVSSEEIRAGFEIFGFEAYLQSGMGLPR